jgi:branched-chain amino acid aminotransferase
MYTADAAFYCGTAAEVVALASLDNKEFAKDWDNSLSSTIQKAYQAKVLEQEFKLEKAVA